MALFNGPVIHFFLIAPSLFSATDLVLKQWPAFFIIIIPVAQWCFLINFGMTIKEISAAPETAPPPVPAQRPHLGVLDVLRGIAALSVCLFHFTSGTNLTKLFVPALAPWFWRGQLGVEAFFVISGFIIPYSLSGTGYRVSHFFPYMRKRIARIVPPAYASLALLLLQWALIGVLLHHPSSRLLAVTPTQLLANLLFVVPFLHNQPWLSGVFWTLALEFQFYVLVGLLYSRLFTTPSVPAFFAWTIGLSLLNVLPVLPGHPGEHFFQFSAFFWLGAATLRYRQGTLNQWQFGVALALFTGLCYWQQGGWATGVGLSTALAIAFVRVNNRFFAWLGKISYSLYLTHMMAGAAAEFLLVRLWPPRTPVEVTLEIGGCVLVAMAVAYVFYRWVELPALRLTRRLNL
jgi:peptidoglycan/LPS O-acetylase OafA/YrhL